MLNLVLLFSLLLNLSLFAAVDHAVYRIKAVTYFQSDVDNLTREFIRTKKCLGLKMRVESYLGFSKFSVIDAKKNRQSLPLAKLIQYVRFSSSKKRDLLLTTKYKKCLSDKNYELLSAEEYLIKNRNYAATKNEVNRNLGHTFFNKTPTKELWNKK